MDNNMYSLRILSKGKITDLSKGFDLGGVPFSIYVRKKGVSMDADLVLRCQLICDKVHGEFPVPVGDWTPAAIAKISPNAIDLTAFDVFWGSGETIK